MAGVIHEVLPNCAALIVDQQAVLAARLTDYLRNLPGQLDGLDAKCAEIFVESSPEKLALKYSAESSQDLYNGKDVNLDITKALALVREEGNKAIDQLGGVATWVNLQVPACETGNNFGVEVQELVLKSISNSKNEISTAVNTLPDYHRTRAESLAHYGKDSWTEIDSSKGTESTKTDGPDGKTETKATEKTNSKEYSKSLRTNKDWTLHTVEIDVQWYFKLRGILVAIRAAHLSVADVVIKNINKLLNPRDNSSRSSQDRGGMMMF